jgi:hypothetical protein
MSDIQPVERELAPGIFGRLSATETVQEAIEVSKALAKVLEGEDGRRPLYVQIGDRRHVMVEGWTLLGSMLKVYPVTAWTRPVQDGEGRWTTPETTSVIQTLHSKWCHQGAKGHKQKEGCETYEKEKRIVNGPGRGGWEARVEVFTAAGQLVGAAEAECRWEETDWQDRDSYAVRSMAATRATSKALRQPLGFIIELAGFSATPAEEMGHEQPEVVEPPFDAAAYIRDSVQIFGKWTDKERADSFKLHATDLLGGKATTVEEVRKVIEAMADNYYQQHPEEAPF